MRLANRCNNNVCKLRLSTKVYNGWLVHSHTNSYLYREQCMGGLTVSLRLFIQHRVLPLAVIGLGTTWHEAVHVQISTSVRLR